MVEKTLAEMIDEFKETNADYFESTSYAGEIGDFRDLYDDIEEPESSDPDPSEPDDVDASEWRDDDD